VLLAVGDALVAQVPALLLSIAAAAIVTRVASPMDLSGQIGSQFGNPKAWIPVTAILTVMGLLPGMPHFIILPIAALAGFFSWRMLQKVKAAAAPAPSAQTPEQSNHIAWSDVTDGAVLNIEIGYGLVPLVDDRKGAPLMQRLTGIRRQLSRELGFVVPLVRVKDNMALGPNSYRIQISGVTLGEDQAWPDDLLALDSGDIDGDVDGLVEGKACKDPTFGLDALWVSPDKRSEAVVSGYTVVDASTVIATHFNHLVGLNAAELFGMDEAQGLLDNLKEAAPQLVEGLTPKPLSLYQITAICRALLSEGVPLKDFRRLSEAMVQAAADDAAGERPSLDAIVDGVRKRIGSLIIQSLVPINMPLPVITLGAELETLLAQAIETGGGASHPVEPGLAQKIVTSVEEAARPIMAEARRFAIVTSPTARRTLLRLLKPRFPETPVLSFEELPDDKAVEVIAVVGGQSAPIPPSEPAEQTKDPA